MTRKESAWFIVNMRLSPWSVYEGAVTTGPRSARLTGARSPPCQPLRHTLATAPHSCFHSSRPTARPSRQPPLAQTKEFLRGDRWNTLLSKRSIPSTSSQRVCTCEVRNPSRHRIQLTTSCPHNCVCWSRPANVSNSSFKCKESFSGHCPQRPISQLETVWSISSLIKSTVE